MQKLRNMRRHWFAALGLAMLVGLLAIGIQAQAHQRVTIDPGWRFHDGYWNYWDPGDNAWYYTDGRSWYTYGDNAWRPYNFDRNFGSKSYRQGYRIPVPGPDIVIPRHKVYVP